MRYRYAVPMLVAAVVMTGCDAGSPTEPAAKPANVAPQAFLTESQILKLTYTRQIGATTIRSYAENFSEVGQPCNEEVSIKGSTLFTSWYSETATGFKLTVLISSLGSGVGNPSGDKYWKYYINFSKDLGSFTTPEKDFTLIQSFKIVRQGDLVPEDDAVGNVYHRLRINAAGEILEHKETSDIRCI